MVAELARRWESLSPAVHAAVIGSGSPGRPLPLGGGGLGWGGRVGKQPWQERRGSVGPTAASRARLLLERHPHPDPPPSRGREHLPSRSSAALHQGNGRRS